MSARLADGTLRWNGAELLTGIGRIGGPRPGSAELRGAEPVGPGGDVWRLTLRVTADAAARVERADALDALLASPVRSTLHFTSAWGAEFAPVHGADEPLALVCRAGRSSHGLHPWLGIQTLAGALIVAPAWSGNWHIDLAGDGRLTAGIAPDDFGVELKAGEGFDAPAVLLAVGEDLEDAALSLQSAVAAILPRTEWSDAMPVEWNHWWPYEDQDITEDVFLDNARIAEGLGIELATLDAGWFGRSDPGSEWPKERGDWELVNDVRFPRGLEALAADTRSAGLEFGIWVEAEAVGADARLRREHPELIATRSVSAGEHPNITVSLDADDPGFLGYVCLGSAAGREHVARSLETAVHSTGARWLKLDFNVDPGAGCDRTDHGHGAADGLYRHYEGLYAVLDEFRARHPEVILEACSSGGLRIDLGLAEHVHCFFLSDPDWTEHALQVLWGASLTLPPAAILHWSWSEWRGEHPQQKRDFSAVSADEFDTMLRAAILHRFGVSLRLPELAPDLRERLALHVGFFREVIAPMLPTARLRNLSGQPLRDGLGERHPAFQLDGPGDRHVLAAFALPGATRGAVAHWAGLDPDRRYRVTAFDGGSAELTGEELLAGVALPAVGTSWLLLAEPVGED